MGRGDSSSETFEIPAPAPAFVPPTVADFRQIEASEEHLNGADWFVAGGCVHLAIAFKEMFPELKIAVTWYSDHGRRGIAHAVAYHPASGLAFDGYGTHPSYEDALLAYHDQDFIETVADEPIQALADHMEINDYNPEAPFANHGIWEGSDFIERVYLGVIRLDEDE